MFHNSVKVLRDTPKSQQQPAGMTLNCSFFYCFCLTNTCLMHQSHLHVSCLRVIGILGEGKKNQDFRERIKEHSESRTKKNPTA